MIIFSNYPLVAAFTSILLAQFIKVPLHYVTKRSWNFGLAFSTGGMPSSHSAAVAALSTAVGLLNGVSSISFAISVVVSSIIMFDASGVRRHAGEHAVVLNRLSHEFDDFLQRTKSLKTNQRPEKRKELKEILGHQPIEVIMGGLLGIVISIIFFFLFYH